MQISEQRLDQYRQIYQKNFGEELSREEALKQGLQLLTLMRHIYQPIPKDADEPLLNNTKGETHEQ